MFQKVDQWMNKDEQQDSDARKKLEDANQVGGWGTVGSQGLYVTLKGTLSPNKIF